MQWAQVRTEAFKKWFGDWETVARQIHLREFINKALADKQWQERTVIAEGDNADPSGKLSDVFGFKVTKQVSAPDDIRKTDKRHGEGNERKQDQIGLTVDDYIKAIEILRNPESYKKTISNNGKPSAEFGRKFIDGTIVVAEVETAEDGTVAIKSVWKKTPGRIHADGTIYPNRTSENTAEVLNSISSNELIVKLDTVSKVVDENGEPLVVYHGTRRQFDEFELSHPRGAMGNKKGAYFTTSKRIAEEYAEDDDGATDNKSRVLSLFLSIKNDSNGTITKDAYGDKEIIVFDPNQIKSATENNGDFGQKDSNIYHQSSKNLALVHNLSLENLLHANKLGGIPVPSVAVVNKNHPMDAFGEITLIVNKDNLGPQVSAKNRFFNADIAARGKTSTKANTEVHWN